MFILAVCGYVGGGLVYARRVQKSTAVGWMAHPHANHWKEVISLIMDGTSFVGSKGGARARSGRHRDDGSSGADRIKYDRIDEEAAAAGKEKRSRQQKQRGETDQKKKKKKGEETSKSSSSTSRKEKSSSARKGSRSRSQDEGGPAQATPASTEKETDKQTVLREQVELDGRLHQSQAKIKVVGLNESAAI